MEWVTGDTKPDIAARLPLLDADGEETGGYANLSTALGVRFQMRRPDDKRFTVNAAATVSDAPNGGVRYTWGANDLSVPGDYYVQWEVTWIDGSKQTSKVAEITIRRQ
jgi:hypothetical protein